MARAAAAARVRVPLLSADQIADVTDVRSLLEGEAAARVATRLEGRDDAELVDVVELMGDGSSSGDRARLFELDDVFHARVWALAASPVLEETLQKLRARVAPLVRQSIESLTDDELGLMGSWHRQYAEALRAGAGEARREARRHAEITRKRISGMSQRPFVEVGP